MRNLILGLFIIPAIICLLALFSRGIEQWEVDDT